MLDMKGNDVKSKNDYSKDGLEEIKTKKTKGRSSAYSNYMNNYPNQYYRNSDQK
jgi:hypothetical protein